jgi:hypothetical protein
MGLTNYPNGISSFGLPIVGSSDGKIPATFTGSYFYVSSTTGSSSNTGTDPNVPVATITQALAKCTSTAGDVIVLLQDHAETLTSASAINITKADVTIVGTGVGTSRAKITMGTAATATIAVNAANVTIKNISFESAIDDCAKVFVVEGKGFTCDGCSFIQSAVDKNFLSLCVVGASTTANVADGFTWINNYRWEYDAACLADVSFLANTDQVLVANNVSVKGSTGNVGLFIIAAALVLLGARILNNHLVITSTTTNQSVGLFMTTSSSTSTGIIANNTMFSRDTTGGLMFTASTSPFSYMENYASGALDKSGAVFPTADDIAG